MVKKLLLLPLLLICFFTHAETIKTDVLVIGNGASAVAAAIQSAHSKLKTVLVVKGAWLEGMQSKNMIVVNSGRNLPSGIWGTFRKEIRSFYKTTAGYDTAYNAPLKFEPYTGASILKKIADTTKNLSIKLNTPFTAIKKDGIGWEVSVTINGKADIIKAKVVIDATEDGELVTKAGAKFSPEISYGSNTYRTSIAMGDDKKELAKAVYPSSPAYYIPIDGLVIKDADNLLVTDKLLQSKTDLQNLPAEMNIGQGAGTIAAYCAFFKTTTKNLRVRVIQGELLDFKGYLLPFDDVNQTDRYFRAIQQITATGLLRGVQKDEQFMFMPDMAVTTAEIKPVLTEIYSRAFLWFNKVKPGEQFTVGDLLSFISEITLTEPKLFQTTMQKEWAPKYKFTSTFDVNHPVTRREFTILANQFLNPFARAVDLNGRMVN
jgi:hypothetical protein